MVTTPQTVAEFLAGKRIAVAGVSRHRGQPANEIYRKLKACDYDVFAINPNAEKVEGDVSFPNLGAIPGGVDGVVVATHPRVAVDVVRQCTEAECRQVWFHRSFGGGSVSNDAIRECEARGLHYIVGGCPLMFCEPVDIAHKCMRWWLQRKKRVPR